MFTSNKEQQLIDTIINEVVKYLHPTRIILFGSRAAGRNKQYSDYDIAIEGANMTVRSERKLKEVLDEKLGIFVVDIINIDKIDNDFRRLILKYGKVIYG